MNKHGKIPINSEVLYKIIESRTSIRKLGSTIGYNEKTIRRGLKERAMSLELILTLAAHLGVGTTDFSDIAQYCLEHQLL